jgi:hypothetical protein
MLAGAQHREINLMPYSKRKTEDDEVMTPEQEVAAVRKAFGRI